MEKETYCLACRKYTKNNNPKVVRNRQNRLMMQSNCATCNSKKSKSLSCKKDTRNIDPKVIKTKNNRKIMFPRCSICNNKKSTFISEVSGLFDSLGLNTPQNRMKNTLWNAFNR